jgi:serine/threonine protein kinase
LKRILSERYELGTAISRSALSQVFEGRDTKTGDAVVVKTLPAPKARLSENVERMEREALALRRIDSPYVCRVLDFGREDRPYLVLEALLGESLAERMERLGTLSIEETAAIARDVLSGLVVAHAAEIVHRDLKPANVFLCQSGAKILDFGVAQLRPEGPDLTTGGATLGSIAYAAPEQIHGSKHVTPRADLYALGTIVFRALAGRLPFPARSADELVGFKHAVDVPRLADSTGRSWPDALESWLAAMVARLPEDRMASADLGREMLCRFMRW